MLEFLGFIALVSIAFGISFGDAITGVLKFIVFGILIIIALGIVAKMLSSKIGSAFVAIAALVFVVLGVLMINDDYDNRYSYCNSIKSVSLYASCVLNANDGHTEAVNKGWGYTIGGIIGCGISAKSWADIDEKEKRIKANIKKQANPKV